MSILKYVLADKEKKAELREGYADVLKHSNTYKLGAGIGNLAGDAVTGVRDFASDITFNPLPYDEYAKSVYDGIQNSYGGWLDDKYNAVADWYNPQPDMMAGGPMSRNGRATVALPMDEPHPYTFDPKGVIPSHEIPGYDRMVNEGYDSWSPSGSYAGDKGLSTYQGRESRITEPFENQLEKEIAAFEAQLAAEEYDRSNIRINPFPQHSPTYFPSPVKREVKKTSDWQQWKDSFKSGWEAK